MSAAIPRPASAEAADTTLPEVCFRRGTGVLHLVVTPPRGHHLSAEMGLRARLERPGLVLEELDGRPRARGATPLSLPLSPVDGAAQWTVRIEAGLCDDAGATCVPFVAEGAVTRPGPARGFLSVRTGLGGPAPTASAGADPHVGEQAAEGEAEFEIQDRGPTPGLRWMAEAGDFEKTLATARAHGRRVIVDFSARWCPPCQRLSRELLHAPAHRDFLSGFEVLIVDADAPLSFALKERFVVTGYPTILLLDHDGTLLDRVVGFPGAEAIRTRWCAAHDDELEGVRRRLAGGDVAGAWAEARDAAIDGKVTSREPWLELATDAGAQLDTTTPEDDRIRAALHNELAALRMGRPGAAAAEHLAAWRLAEKLGDTESGGRSKAAILALAAILDEAVPAGPMMDETGVRGTVVASPAPVLDDLTILAAVLAEIEPDPRPRWATTAILASAAALVATGAVPPSRDADLPRKLPIELPGTLLDGRIAALALRDEGRMHDVADALIEAGATRPAEQLLDAMVKQFPTEFPWPFRLAGFLLKGGRAVDAEAPAREALVSANGDQILRATARLAEVLVALHRNDEARALLATALDAPAPAEAVRTHRYRAQLQTLLSGLDAQGTP